MATPTFESLRQTLKTLRRRRSNLFLLKQTSWLLVALSALALLSVSFSAWRELDKAATIFLFIIVLAVAAAMLWQFFKQLQRRQTDDRKLAHYVEDHIPDLEQRLLTSLEFSDEELRSGREGVSQQFIQQLWQDAQEHVQQQQRQVETVMPAQSSWLSAGAAALSVTIVVAALLGSELLNQAGSRLVWPFAINEPVIIIEPQPDIEISVEPGNLEMQRGEGLTIIARVSNAIPAAVNLRLQDDNLNWRDVSMNRDGSGSDSATYSYFIPSLQEDTTYYISFNEGEEFSSSQYQISLFDLPQIEQIDLAFSYPEYTGLEARIEEDSGDMVVPEGTVVEMTVQFNKIIAEANLDFDEAIVSEDDEQPPISYPDMPLQIDGDTGYATFTVMQDGVYRINARDPSDMENRNPLDYFIRAIVDQPPELALQRPGRDQDVMPLEEVVLEVNASDDYGLSEFRLNYSVVGSDEVSVDFLPEPNVRDVSGNELIYLEELGVEPGDFVSYFLTLADNNSLHGPAEVISDIYFLQVIPTDQEFRRAGGGLSGGQGAGGGQGGDSSALVSIQKDIIAATWKLRNRMGEVSDDSFSADAEIIAESQREATSRARMSIDRLAERLNFSDSTYDAAVENLSLAIVEMNRAAEELELEQITSALQPEQLALQYILKAEANINRTNISMQQAGGGGGGGAQQEREDLRELFEMEMGQLENRYETPNSAGGGNQQQSEEANKLEELARRQEGLTRAQRNLARRQDQMTEEQKRRELERLMRQQEQLSREVAQLAEQMSRGQQQSQSSQSQSQSQSQAQSQSQSSSGGSSSSGGQQQQQTALQRAAQQMQEAAESDSPSIAAARSQKALDNLRQQQQQMNQEGERSVNQLAQNLSQRGQQLLQQQRALQEALQNESRQQGLGQTRQSVRNDADLQELIEQQQQQQRDLDEIEDMLRAVIARGDADDQRLLSQAQEASRELRPIREEMQTSNRVLRNGMVNLSVDIEQELENQLEDFARTLAGLDPSRAEEEGGQIQQAARDAEALREQVEALQAQAEAFNAGQGGDEGTPSIRQMREQLAQTQQLARNLQQQMEQQAGQQGGNQSGQAGGRQQIGGARGNADSRRGGSTEADTSGNPVPFGNARSIRQQLTQQDIEDFLNQPELFRQLLQPILELEGALRAQAELENINQKLFASVDEDVPEEYRDLVQEYYRVLSENQGSSDSIQQ